MNGRRAKLLRRRSAEVAASLPEGPPVAEIADCCLDALADQWAREKTITCPECGRPWSAVVIEDVASWWTPDA